MKNASISDVEEAKRTGVLREDRMYAYEFVEMLFHGKRKKPFVDEVVGAYYSGTQLQNMVTIAETADGELCLVNLNYICSPIKGPALTPKKQRKPHVKGTKPERKIPYGEGMYLKVGDKVLISNGARGVVKCIADSNGKFLYFVADVGWFYPSGHSVCGWMDITHIILPYEESQPAQKTEEQQDFEDGKWVPWIATKDSVCPKWVQNALIDTLWSDGDRRSWAVGQTWVWSNNYERYIVAYRKAQ